jgi:hypothetical protein
MMSLEKTLPALLTAAIACALVTVGCGETGGSATSQGGEPGASVASSASSAGAPATAVSSEPAKAPPKAPTAVASVAALGHPTRSSGCRVRGLLPDRACTPGAVFAGATVGQICTPGYSRSVRNVPESVKQSVYAEYGIPSHTPGSYEVDHLVSLELGGNNTVANLWPEIAPGYHEKDGIENRLHQAVCSRSVSLRTAQVQIARDWRHTFVGAPTASPSYSTPASSPASTRVAEPSTAADGTPAGFCTTHTCIASFAEGRGTIVQCADGEWSHSGGLQGVCSRHGGAR